LFRDGRLTETEKSAAKIVHYQAVEAGRNTLSIGYWHIQVGSIASAKLKNVFKKMPRKAWQCPDIALPYRKTRVYGLDHLAENVPCETQLNE